MRLVDYQIPLLGAQEPPGRLDLNVPITERQRISVRGDRFFADGKDLPLFGVNLGVATLDNRRAFDFLASIGVNVVRIQAPYRTWGQDGQPEVPASARLELLEKDFAKLCRQQKICEDLGIYVLIRDLAQGLGPPYYPAEDADRYKHFGTRDSSVLGLWHPGVRRLVMARLDRLLKMRNPQTGRPFGASPALLGIQLTNETEWQWSDPHLSSSERWKQLSGAPDRIASAVAVAAGVGTNGFRDLAPAERLKALARATDDAYSEALEVMEAALSRRRPLLVGDNSPWFLAVAPVAHSACDAYGWNIYPKHPGGQTLAMPFDLRREEMLDRFQVRIADKPTVITETGEKLAAGGQARLIADATARAANYGYAGVVFHCMYKGIYGEKSEREEWLKDRTPRDDFEIASDPAALCALQACSVPFRNRLFMRTPVDITVSDSLDSFCNSAVQHNRRLDDVGEFVSDGFSEVKNKVGSLSATILVKIGPRSVRNTVNPGFSGNVEIGHLRAGSVELDWHTDSEPENDWVFIRVPLKPQINLIVLVGRAKPFPPPAEQSFFGAVARLSGMKTYTWPDPRTGYGDRQVVRRPGGPSITLHGDLWLLEADGKASGPLEIDDKTHCLLPDTGIRFLEKF